jgi:uncharacterized OsmC-like protein
MVKINALYNGQKHCELFHVPSRSKIETDAPKDNQGKGERFSPTDLMAAALASCVLTTMAIVAERDSITLDGSRAEVQKVMTPAPRRIESLEMHLTLPAKLTFEQRAKLEEVARNCPVYRSLHPDILLPMTFMYS